MKAKLSGEKNKEFNRAVVILQREGMTKYAIRKAFMCRDCGKLPDKRNLYKTLERYKEVY